MAHQIVWCDIPVTDMNRAIHFYSAVLGAKVEKMEFQGKAIALLPHELNDVGACLTQMDGDIPSPSGPLLYLNAKGRLDDALSEVENHGGRILQPKHSIAPHGWRAIVLDSEGNRIALHSM